MYYSNSVYWTKKLNIFHDEYYKRYIGISLLNSISRDNISKQIWDIHSKYTDQYTSHLVGNTIYPKQFISDYSDMFFALVNENYKFFLRRYINDENKENNYQMVLGTDKELEILNQFDKKLNIKKAWSGRFQEGLGDISNSEFQYESLRDLIKVAKFIGADFRIIVAPYNKLLSEERSPDITDKYEKIQKTVLSIAEDEGIPYIDGTDLNEVPGIFKDQMHLSDYIGHEYIYKKISEHYAKD